MNTTQLGILALMKSAVTGKGEPLPEGFSLAEAIPLIRAHQLVPLAYTGASYCGMSMLDPTMQKLLKRYGMMLLRSERQMLAVERVYEAFEANGIDYMPVKGCLMKGRYPTPDIRVMGDADILIRVEQYGDICPVLVELGFEEVQESDHEQNWKSPDLYLELHKRLIPSYNRDYYSYFGDGWRLAARHQGHRYFMTQEDEYIYLFTHFAKHYRDGGIGCRHVLDLWVMGRWMQEPNWGYIGRELEKLYLGEFHRNILRVLEVWFEGGAPDERTEMISQIIFHGGTWGDLKNHVLAEELRNRKANEQTNRKRRPLLELLFPPAESLQFYYPILKKHRWLTPAVWIWRGIVVVLFRRDRIKNQKRRFELLEQEDISDYEKSLRMVGLEFRFEDET